MNSNNLQFKKHIHLYSIQNLIIIDLIIIYKLISYIIYKLIAMLKIQQKKSKCDLLVLKNENPQFYN